MPYSLTRISPTINHYGISVCLCILLVVLGVSTGYVHAAQIRTEQELAELKDSIRVLQSKLQADRGRQKSITGQLESIERDRSKLDAEFAAHSLELEDLQVQKMEVSTRLHYLELEWNRAKADLRHLMLASYMLSKQDGLQLALEQASPVKVAATMEMYRYILDAHQRRIEYTIKTHDNFRQAASRVEQQQNAINLLLRNLQANKEQLTYLEKERNKQLAVINTELSKGENQVRQYEIREAELHRLLESLAQKREAEKESTSASAGDQGQSTASPPKPTDAGLIETGSWGFSGSRGRLQMPAYGKVLKKFGQKRPESGLAWDGIMLGVEEGQQVSAIYRGQVVFSDWFGSFGQLLVLDHGDGYMSLYGHNQLLHVGIGRMVDSGQKIASAGSTGGLSRAALYFEIRHNGNPDDPLKWCKL